jgi:hypothetical protein
MIQILVDALCLSTLQDAGENRRLLCTTADGRIQIETRMQSKTVWLMRICNRARLFQFSAEAETIEH